MGAVPGIHAGMLRAEEVQLRQTAWRDLEVRLGRNEGYLAGRISRRQELHDRRQGTGPARRPGGPREQEHRRRGASLGGCQRGALAGLGGGDELSWTECRNNSTDRLDERARGPLIHVVTHANSLGDLEHDANVRDGTLANLRSWRLIPAATRAQRA